jgi:hypothetical protein
MKSLAEVAIAADSTLYRSSPDSPAKQTTIAYATLEAPRVIAMNVRFFLDNQVLNYWSGDNAAYYYWHHEYHPPFSPQTQNTPHAQFELGSLAVIYEDQSALDDLLSRAGYSERIGLSPTILVRFTTTFLRLIWNIDNYVGDLVDGSVDGTSSTNWNEETAGFVALSPYDSWVWIRARDSLALTPTKLRDDNYAALLRYR